MKVIVRYVAQLRHAAGRSGEEVILDGPSRLQDLLDQLAARHDDSFRRLLLDATGGVQSGILLFVGDRQISEAAAVELKNGDEITVLAPMAGG